MRRALVRHGDPTTTGGFVIAYSSAMFDDGRRIALHGEEATCGNCKGSFKLFGTGTDCTENGRSTVLHGDPIMCPCGKNKVIAGGNATCFIDSGSSSSSRSASEITLPAMPRFPLRDASEVLPDHRRRVFA